MPDHSVPQESVQPTSILATATLVTVGCVVVALAAPSFDIKPARYWSLVGASVGFLLVAWSSGATTHRYGRWMLGGLLLCAAGDVLGPLSFVVGSTMFLVAHILFVTAFWAWGINYRHVAPALVMLVPGGLLLNWLIPQVDESMRWLIVAYTSVITAMVITAAGTHRLILIGATIFYVSDIFVARWKFVDHDSINAFFCYPLYYTACLILAHSIRLAAHHSSISSMKQAANT